MLLFVARAAVEVATMSRLLLALFCVSVVLGYEQAKDENQIYAKMFSALMCDTLVEDVSRYASLTATAIILR